MTFGAMPLPPWAIALVVAALAPMLVRTLANVLVQHARSRSAEALRDAERSLATSEAQTP